MKENQTILIHSEDREVQITLAQLGNELNSENSKFAEKAKRITKKEADNPLFLRRV